MNEIKPQLLRAKQVAKMCGISKATVWRYSHLGKITAVKISDGVTAFRMSEIEKVFKLKEA